MPDHTETSRRHFLRLAAAGLAAFPAAWPEARARGVHASGARPTEPERPTKRTDFDAMHQVRAGDLDIGYAESGPADGPAVVLLHGWPYDIHSYVDVAPILARRGYRVVVPYLRGFGTTRFRSPRAFRNAQQSAVALDVVALMDALRIPRAIVGGFDWGSRTAAVVAALWPERCRGIVAVSGYLVTDRVANRRPLPPEAELAWWYQYYFATERGRIGYAEHRREFNRMLWRIGSPRWDFDDATYDRSARAFDNPDHVAIVVHNYRWRLGLAEGEARFDALERRLAAAPPVTVPSVTIGSDFDGAAADGKRYAARFAGPHAHRVLPGIGHNVPQEAPDAFAESVLMVEELTKSARR